MPDQVLVHFPKVQFVDSSCNVCDFEEKYSGVVYEPVQLPKKKMNNAATMKKPDEKTQKKEKKWTWKKFKPVVNKVEKELEVLSPISTKDSAKDSATLFNEAVAKIKASENQLTYLDVPLSYCATPALIPVLIPISVSKSETKNDDPDYINWNGKHRKSRQQ